MKDFDTDAEVAKAIRFGIAEAVQKKLSGTYSNPLDKLLDSAIERNKPELVALVGDAIAFALGDVSFRDSITQSIRSTLAKMLISRFGGEIEKQVNALKSDPTTRSRITVAIDDVIKSMSKP